MRHSTEYLYGINPLLLAEMPYKKALYFKLDSAKQLFDKLYLDTTYQTRDDEHVDAVYKALKHTRGLINELDPLFII